MSLNIVSSDAVTDKYEKVQFSTVSCRTYDIKIRATLWRTTGTRLGVTWLRGQGQ